ncbi:MAG: hypothetical protein GEV12_16215 [Micromonosporaceae bacterium]|nr:hypothetical protein [Micromonosporaceae bacterium]
MAEVSVEVSATDCTDLAKVLVRADPGGALAAALDVPFGRAVRDGNDALVVRTAPDAWLLLAAADLATPLVRRVEALGAGEFASVVDVTHGHALARLTGTTAAVVLAKLCAIDLADPATPDGNTFRSLVAGVAVTVVRDDARPGRLTAGSAGATPAGGRDARPGRLTVSPTASLASLDRSDALGSAGATPAGGRDAERERSYLLLCDRSYRQYLRDVLTDAGEEFGLAWT